MGAETYHDVYFSPEIIKQACERFFDICGKTTIKFQVDKIEKEISSLDEIVSLYQQYPTAFISITRNTVNLLYIQYGSNSYRITVFLQKNNEKDIFQIFDNAFSSAKIDTIDLKRHDVSKQKTYYLTKFPQQTIQEVFRKVSSFIALDVKQDPPSTLKIYHDDEEWDYSSYDEFFAEYNKVDSYYISHHLAYGFSFGIRGDKSRTTVSVTAPSSEKVQSVFQIFERDLDKNILQIDSDELQIFIGHGQSSQWKELKDHLHEKHGLNVIAYELGTRAGYSIQEVLNDMLDESSLALIVLTGEDLDMEGKYHARENVIHELGLFQGRLGFKRAIALKEEGVTEFSNIHGLNQLRFSKDNIKEVFGDVLAIIKEEYSRK